MSAVENAYELTGGGNPPDTLLSGRVRKVPCTKIAHRTKSRQTNVSKTAGSCHVYVQTNDTPFTEHITSSSYNHCILLMHYKTFCSRRVNRAQTETRCRKYMPSSPPPQQNRIYNLPSQQNQSVYHNFITVPKICFTSLQLNIHYMTSAD